jgi:hypothetical protein
MMDMYSRNQYLKQLRIEYLKTKLKKEKARLLDEAGKRTGLDRKYLIRKLRPLSTLDKKKAKRRRRKELYDGYVRAALVKCWEIFDYPCGQRLAPLLLAEVPRLEKLNILQYSPETLSKLQHISPATIDRKLKHEREVLYRLGTKACSKPRSLLYEKIPIRLNDWQCSDRFCRALRLFKDGPLYLFSERYRHRFWMVGGSGGNRSRPVSHPRSAKTYQIENIF